MKSFNILLPTLLMVLFATTAHAGKFYKWVDAEGNMQYSDAPPKGSEQTVETIKTSSFTPNPTPVTPAVNASANTAEEESSEQPTITQLKYDQAACEQLQKNLAAIHAGGRFKEKTEDGEFRYLGDDEVASRLKDTQGKLKSC